MTHSKHETPLLDELTRGEWPSFVSEIQRRAESSEMCADLLGQLEDSYRQKVGHWKHGGIVGVRGYGGGVIGRYSDAGDRFPACSQFHTVRVNHPAGWFYTTRALRRLCDVWEAHGSGLTNLHGSTGDLVLLGTTTDRLEPLFAALTEEGWDLGGSGSDVRTPSACCGPARCEWALYDTLALCHDLTLAYQDELHRPQFPYKFKLKFSGCPNDCVAAIARADLSFIGTFADPIRVSQDGVREYVESGLDLVGEVLTRCPTQCIRWDGGTLEIDDESCVRCMHCINAMPKALRPGTEGGVTILLGAKAPIVNGAQLSSVLVPFWKPEPPYDDLKALISNIWDVWCEEGKNRERIGEFVRRVGLANFLGAIGLDPHPAMVAHPRDNPYVPYRDEGQEE